MTLMVFLYLVIVSSMPGAVIVIRDSLVSVAVVSLVLRMTSVEPYLTDSLCLLN